MTSSFNLSDWALRHKSFVIYLMLVSAIAGLMAYNGLGREEDPPFTIKTMVVKTLWPGATTTETINQITDRIEKKLEEVPHLDYVRSYTKPGESVVFVNLKDSVRASEVPDLWYQVRKKVGDIRQNLPSGIYGPYFNDEFGDTYSIIYALTTDGFSRREVRDHAERVRTALLLVPDVAKVDLIGVQDEKIYLEFSTQQIAALGLDINALVQALQSQNAVVPSGTVEAGPERIAIRVSGGFSSEESLKAINFQSNGRFFRLSDIAKVRRGYVDPAQPMFRFNGEPAIGLAVAMAAGGDALALGKNIRERAERVTAELPIGIDMSLVADQPHVVNESVHEFVKTLMEAIAIVLLVSFLALGWRPGVVVAIAIPLVLAVTFVLMKLFGISLQRISLGALIIALGLLVDDAMIAVEMMITKLEEGYDKVSAATYTYTSTAFPMLTGTLVTVAGFVPVGFAKSGAGEYCFTLFAVVGIALIVSWIVAVLFTPLTGIFILPDTLKKHGGHGSSRFSRWFHRTLDNALRNKAPRAGGHRRALPALPRRHALRAAAVLPRLRPARAARQSDAAAERLAQRHAGGGGAGGEAVQRGPRHRVLELLCRPGRHPLLSPPRCAARQRLLRAGRGRHQGLQAARRRAGTPREGPGGRLRQRLDPRQPAGARAPGRLAGEVPRQRPGSRHDARAGPCDSRKWSARTSTRATSTTTGTSPASRSASRSTRIGHARSASLRSSSPTTSTRFCRAPTSRSCATRPT